MSGMVSRLKRRVPWWGKIGLKIGLSRLPFAYRLWKQLSLFEHGTMDSPEYAMQVFAERVKAAGFQHRLEGAVCLELGPGDSLFSALIARGHGAARTYLVDVGNFCVRDMAAYERMADVLTEAGRDVRPAGGFRDLDHMLAHCRAEYLTDGLAALRRIPSGSVDFVWSQAVLEHVRADNFAAVMAELRRITKPDGVGSHEIDLADHLGGALNNLRFSRRLWESRLFAEAGFYTNRIPYAEMLEAFRAAGFETEVVDIERWPSLPTPRARLAPEFAGLPESELTIRVFDVVLRPASAA